MTKTMYRGLCITALCLTVLTPLGAITFGLPDGNNHPNVGTLVAEFDGVKYSICSGTLIAPDVFLTAAHCTAYFQARGLPLWVSFDTVFDESTATLYPGTPYTNPEYTWRQDDPADIAVVVLDEPISTITPATLPTAGLLDALATKNGLKRSTFTAVGYGAQEASFGGGPPVFGAGDTRMYSMSSFNALNKAWLRLSQNPATGDGGTCYGDSGGPNFLEIGGSEILVALTVTGDAICRATNVVYRLDTPMARSFLADFVSLP